MIPGPVRRVAAGALIALLLALLAGPVVAEPEYFVRNRPVPGRPMGGEIYVSPHHLGQLFTAEEQARLAVEGGQALVDGTPVAPLDSAGDVPLLVVARALGFEVRRNPQLGQVDLLPPGALLTTRQRSAASATVLDPRRRPEYQVAAGRMQQILRVLREVPADSPQARRVRRIGNRVADTSPLADLPWNFHVVREREPNAACAGEGHVFVTTGLLEMGLSDDELAGVLGHEIAHGVRRHPFRLVDLRAEAASLMAEMDELERDSERARSGQGVAPNPLALENRADELGRRAESLLYRLEHERAYDREDEEEADILGLQYAVTAGFSADGLARALMRLDALSVRQFGEAVLEDDMTHPPVSRRLEILRRVQESWRR